MVAVTLACPESFSIFASMTASVIVVGRPVLSVFIDFDDKDK